MLAMPDTPSTALIMTSIARTACFLQEHVLIVMLDDAGDSFSCSE